MLKAKVNIQVLKVDRRLITLFKPFFRGKEIKSFEMSIFFEILVRIASYGPQIDQSRGENRLSHIIMTIIINYDRHISIRKGFLGMLFQQDFSPTNPIECLLGFK